MFTLCTILRSTFYTMQKSINIAGLKLLSLEKAFLQSLLLVAIWELGFHKCSHHFLIEQDSLLCPDYLRRQCSFYWMPTFALRVWNFTMCQGQCASRPAPNKNSGHWVSNELPWAETSYKCWCIFVAVEKCTLYDLSWWGQSIRKPTRGFFQTPSILINCFNKS